jgi:hypothetical protein
MKITVKLVSFGSITFGENPRINILKGIETLQDSISANGLMVHPMVHEIGGGLFKMIRGNCRLTAIARIKEENPVRFNELFGKGVPCQVVSDVTPEEVIELTLDHSDSRPLTDPHELQRSANMLFSIGKTEADVAVTLAGLIDAISPMRPDNRKELDALKAKTAEAVKSGNAAAVELCKRAEKDYLFNYRRGFVQNLHNIYRCPEIVMASLYYKATGEKPAKFKDVELPPVTTAQAVSLYKLHNDDCKELDPATGMSKFNKAITGPKFNEGWDNIVAKAKAALEKGPGEPKPKAMAASEMDNERKGFQSLLAVRLTRRHMGEKGITDIAVLDDHAYRADLVRNNDPKAWAEFVNLANKIEGELVAKAKAATVTVKA